MNLVLFEANELEAPLPRTDRRVEHVLNVLKRAEGDSFDAGIINGPRGKATVMKIAPASVTFIFDPSSEASAVPAITVIIGLPRPQTARDILRDATTLGVGALHFIRADRAEGSYRQSTLWASGEWRRHVILGAEQAFDTRIPEVTHGASLADTLTAITTADASHPAVRLCLDNYESPGRLAEVPIPASAHATLAIGPERGWSAAERDQLRAAGFTLVHLGTRVLRAETAVVAALTLVRSKLGLM